MERDATAMIMVEEEKATTMIKIALFTTEAIPHSYAKTGKAPEWWQKCYNKGVKLSLIHI
eukprot:7371655-Prorocentrum_lima.AAC.1